MGQKTGRPSDWGKQKLEQLEALMRMKPTLEDTAHFFKCSTSTIEKVIKRNFKQTFSEFRAQNMVQTRFLVYRELINQAKAGNTAVLIFMAKKLIPEFEENAAPTGEGRLVSYTLNYNLDD